MRRQHLAGGKREAPNASLRQRIEAIDSLLVREYDEPDRWNEDPFDSLIATILSQNTNDRNSEAAYDAMREAFPAWQDVMNAEPAALEAALRPGGLARTKARRIQELLRGFADRGGFSLAYLEELLPEDAEKELLKLNGVGRKTARCVLLFAMHMDIFPIDTHIERVLKRLCIVPDCMPVEKAHAYVDAHMPPGRSLALHLNLIRHGRTICHARAPECNDCVLRSLCMHRPKQAS